MLTEVKNITIRQTFIGMFAFMGAVSPGAIVIFYFDPDLFKALDTVKLMILSMGISVPVVVLNLFTADIYVKYYELDDRKKGVKQKEYDSPEDKRKDDQVTSFVVALWSSAVVFYISLGFILVKEPTLFQAFLYAVSIQACMSVFAIITKLKNKKLQQRLENLAKKAKPENYIQIASYNERQVMDVQAIQKQIQEFVGERDWDQFHDPKNLSMALSVEASELVQEFQWLTPEEASELKQDPEKHSKVADELADIAVYLLRIADKLDVDIEEAIRIKMLKNAEKYPADKVKGSSKKYTEYTE